MKDAIDCKYSGGGGGNSISSSMTHLLLFFLFIFALLLSPALQSELSSAPHESSDYNDYGDDEDVPAQQVKSPDLKATMMPYFEEKESIIYVKPNSTVQLDCPVKNYNATTMEIVWYKNNQTITNGYNSLSKTYHVDKNFSLIINHALDGDAAKYDCEVMPQMVRHQIKLEIGEPPIVKADDTNSSGLTQAVVFMPFIAATLAALAMA